MVDITVSVSCEEPKLTQVTNFNNLFMPIEVDFCWTRYLICKISMLVHQNVNIMTYAKTRLLILLCQSVSIW